MFAVNLCLLTAKEVAPYAASLKPFLGGVQALCRDAAQADALRHRFAQFVYNESTIAEAVHGAFIARKKKLALAESCTGGAVAARLVSIPDASRYFLGSVVAYSDEWKERFLQVSHSTIKKEGAVSLQAVQEMVQGLFAETNADFALAISGLLAPSPGFIYIAVGHRGQRIDAGKIQAPPSRDDGIELATQTALGVLFRRIVHHTITLS